MSRTIYPHHPSQTVFSIGQFKKLFMRKPLSIRNDQLTKHLLLTDKSCTLMYQHAENLLKQQLVNGGGWLYSTHKRDLSLIKRLTHAAQESGRSDEILLLDFSNPAESQSYSPTLYGSPDEVASRLVSIMPNFKNSAGLDFFKRESFRVVRAVVAATQAQNLAITQGDLVGILSQPEELESLLAKTQSTETAHGLKVVLDSLRKAVAPYPIDEAKLNLVLGGLLGRMAMLSFGRLSPILNKNEEAIDLVGLIKNDRMIYVVLPCDGTMSPVTMVAQMLITHLQQAIEYRTTYSPASVYLAMLDKPLEYARALYEQDDLQAQLEASQVGLITLCDRLRPASDIANLVESNASLRMCFQSTALKPGEFIFSDPSGKVYKAMSTFGCQ